MRQVLISAAMSAWCVSCGGGDSPTCAEGFERAGNNACDLVEPSDSGIPSGDTDDRDEDDDTEVEIVRQPGVAGSLQAWQLRQQANNFGPQP